MKQDFYGGLILTNNLVGFIKVNTLLTCVWKWTICLRLILEMLTLTEYVLG